MSPFLAEVHVFNLASDAKSFTTTARPDAPDTYTDAIAELRASYAQIKANAKAIATAADQARQATAQVKEHADNDGDSDGVDKLNSNDSAKQFYGDQAKPKSNDEDMVFAAIPIVAIVFTFLYLIVRALMAPFNNRNKRGAQSSVVMEGLSTEEAAILDKLQRTLAQMESRVESLETILIDQVRTKEKYGTKL